MIWDNLRGSDRFRKAYQSLWVHGGIIAINLFLVMVLFYFSGPIFHTILLKPIDAVGTFLGEKSVVSAVLGFVYFAALFFAFAIFSTSLYDIGQVVLLKREDYKCFIGRKFSLWIAIPAIVAVGLAFGTEINGGDLSLMESGGRAILVGLLLGAGFFSVNLLATCFFRVYTGTEDL